MKDHHLPDTLTTEEIEAAVVEHGSIRAAARALRRDESTLRRRLRRAGSPTSSAPADEKTTVEVGDDEVVLTMPGSTKPAPDAVMALVRENGLDPAEWVIVSVTLNRWNALGKADESGENPTKTLRQVKVTLRPVPERVFPTPVVHAPELVKPQARVRVSVDEPDVIFVEGDEQAPYHDPTLDALMTRATHEVQPVEQVFLGDGADFPMISRHADHPAAMATVQECLDTYYGILRRRAEAAPNARRRKLKGNHDWRLESELLGRAERMYGIRPVGEEMSALSLARLLHFDRLGIELVEDPRGFEHAEVELVPGMTGLVVRHGWITGANTADRSLKRRGRSLIVGHNHKRDSAYWYDPSAGVEREAHVLGTMSLARDRRFPHFAVCDEWTQGAGVVVRWPDGRFLFEHMRYSDGVLTWRDRRWQA